MPRKNGFGSLLCVLTLAFAPLLAVAQPSPYDARYSVYRNGKLVGMLRIALTIEDGIWQLESHGRGTHGLARILAATDHELASGQLVDGRFIPLTHERTTRISGIEDGWRADFDWDSRVVTVSGQGETPRTLDLDGNEQDPLAMKLEMRERLLGGGPLDFVMLDEDRFEAQRFRRLPEERMETALGCLETWPVEEVRKNNRRYTRAWHAPRLGLVEVRVEHGKTGGDHVEMRINALSIDGTPVEPFPGCGNREP